jgi:hypothetical protein
MRCNRLGLAIAGLVIGLFSLITGAEDAQAFGDTCHNPLHVRGDVRNSYSSAMASARANWETAVARRHGGRFANWYYSGDREMECTWDRSETRFRCTTTAMPCGRKR